MPILNFSLSEFIDDKLSLEAAISGVGNVVVDPTQPMKIKLITDKILEASDLLPVSDPIAFSNGIPTENGLFSEKIFGQTVEERRRKYAYINLNGVFFHPYVYEVLKFLYPKKFEKCASGKGSWFIDPDGQLIELEKDDKRYDIDNCGLNWLIRNYHKLKPKETNSMIRKDRIKFLNSLKDEDIFITKWIVIPVIYRDVDMKKAARSMPELNENYNKIIRYANSIKDSTFDFFNNELVFNIMMEMVAIRKYGQSLLEKKRGFVHRYILGKSIDRGSRDVISVQTFNNIKRPDQSPVDVEHTGIPLAKCLIIGYNFIMRYCLQFFEDNFRNMTEYPVYKFENGEYKLHSTIKIKNPLEKFNTKFIEKKMNRFKNSHATRFELITLEAEDGTEIPIHLSGQFAPLTPSKYTASTILNRPMTWTDLFYLAAVDTMSDKYVYITRYPITSISSIFASLCRPLSTIETVPAFINGQLYPFYPVIDLNTPTAKISNLFADTVSMSDLYLDALGGDYDGDQVSVRLCFSIEANAEAMKNVYSPVNYVTPEGKLLKVLGNEAYLTFFNMTRDTPVGGILSNEKKEKLLKINSKEITSDMIASMFGYTTKIEKDDKGNKKFIKNEPEFNLRDKLTLDANEYINTERITTTVGIFLFNKLMVEDYISTIVPGGFYNKVCDKKIFGKLSDIVAKGVLDEKIDIKTQLIPWLNAYEFWGLVLVTIFAPSFSMELIAPNKELEKMKKDLLENAPDHSLNTLTSIESKLVKKADEVLKGTPGKYLFDSGARGSFSNDYKNMSLSIGVVENPVTGEYDFMKSNYIGGIKKEDLSAAANIIVNAEYPKAIGTAKGGYMTKQLYAANQNIQIDEDESDCGTKMGIRIFLTNENLSDYYDQYLIDGKKLVLITENIDKKYLNKEVIIRSPMYCLSEKICSKCAGKRFYKVGIKNIGLTSSALSGSVQNAQLKLRHNLSINVDKINENEILL